MGHGTPKSCATCGGDFIDESPTTNRRFCGRRCWRRAKARRAAGQPEADQPKPSDCPTCGAKIEGRGFTARYCSEQCRARGRYRERRGLPIANAVDKTCEYCGAEMERSDWQARRWCSPRCTWRGWQLLDYYEKRPVLARNCLTCGEPISASEPTHKKYCNKKCAGRNRSPEVIFRQTHARRVRFLNARVTRVPKRVIARLRSAVCAYCPAPATTVDHVVPISKGGKHAEGNLVPACLRCNSSKGDKLLIEWRRWKAMRLQTVSATASPQLEAAV